MTSVLSRCGLWVHLRRWCKTYLTSSPQLLRLSTDHPTTQVAPFSIAQDREWGPDIFLLPWKKPVVAASLEPAIASHTWQRTVSTLTQHDSKIPLLSHCKRLYDHSFDSHVDYGGLGGSIGRRVYDLWSLWLQFKSLHRVVISSGLDKWREIKGPLQSEEKSNHCPRMATTMLPTRHRTLTLFLQGKMEITNILTWRRAGPSGIPG